MTGRVSSYRLSIIDFRLLIVTMAFLGSCDNSTNDLENTQKISGNLAWKRLTAAIIEDGFSPPVAGRIYAYSYLAQYEALALGDSSYCSFQNTLNGFSPFVPTIRINPNLYVPEVAAIGAFLKTGKHLVYRGFIIDDYYKVWVETIRASGINQETLDYNLSIAKVVSDSVISYSKTDMYRETRNMPLFDIPDGWGSWEPTPPAYGTAIEPYWEKIRPFVLTRIEEFETNYDLNYDTTHGSPFFMEAMVVYDSVNKLDDEGKSQAEYWDCNPRETIASGHMMVQVKQMNPGGHWLAIGQTVMENLGLSTRERIKTNAILALTLHDAFIVCWNEKYKTNLIRPETYINRYIDPKWRPILETPLFPEFTSGHSVISTASATVLTEMMGDSIEYIDSVNFFLGLPPRSFGSFSEAAGEAAMSRMLGGIHYMPAIELGITQGEMVADSLLAHFTQLKCYN